jgi:hypothetical protein
MLIVYEAATGAVLHNTGLRSFADPTPEEWYDRVLQVRAPERPMTSYGFHHVTDAGLATEIMNAGSYELQFADGQPIGVLVYPRVQLACPAVVAAGDDLEVVATVPGDSQDTSAAFSVEGGGSAVESVTDGKATTLFQFASPGRYSIWVETAHHGAAGAGVIVQ